MLLRMSLLGMVAAMVLSLAPVVGSDDREQAAADGSGGSQCGEASARPTGGPGSRCLACEPPTARRRRHPPIRQGAPREGDPAWRCEEGAGARRLHDRESRSPAPVQPTAVEASIEKILDETAESEVL